MRHLLGNALIIARRDFMAVVATPTFLLFLLVGAVLVWAQADAPIVKIAAKPMAASLIPVMLFP